MNKIIVGLALVGISTHIGAMEYRLHKAVTQGNLRQVRELLAQDEPANFPDGNGWTPLHHAADCNEQAITKLLIAHGASITARGDERNSPLQVAAANEHFEVCPLLLQGIIIQKILATKDAGEEVTEWDRLCTSVALTEKQRHSTDLWDHIVHSLREKLGEKLDNDTIAQGMKNACLKAIQRLLSRKNGSYNDPGCTAHEMLEDSSAEESLSRLLNPETASSQLDTAITEWLDAVPNK